MKRKQFFVLALGATFLIVLTWLGTFATTYVAPQMTAQIQTVQVGPDDVTLRVDPNPPSISQPATLSIRVSRHTSHQPLQHAQVTLDGTMETMEMGTTEVKAAGEGAGMYVARMPFTMSGPWQVQVLIAVAGQPLLNAVFTVTAQ